MCFTPYRGKAQERLQDDWGFLYFHLISRSTDGHNCDSHAVLTISDMKAQAFEVNLTAELKAYGSAVIAIRKGPQWVIFEF